MIKFRKISENENLQKILKQKKLQILKTVTF